MGGPENGKFPLLFVIKMSLHREWVVLKSLKTPLRNIKMAPKFVYVDFSEKNKRPVLLL